MRRLLLLTILGVAFLSCKSKTRGKIKEAGIQLIFTDSTKNFDAKWDLRDFNYRSKLEHLLGLSDLRNGADSLEIRLWSDFSFSDSQEFYRLSFIDTSCVISYSRVYLRPIDFTNESRDRNWNPREDPIIDSSISRTVSVSMRSLQHLNPDSIWLLKSQSDLNIPDSIGFTDCYNYILEIADRKRVKYLRHHCPDAYYEATGLKEIREFAHFFEGILSLASKYNSGLVRNGP